MDHRPPPSFPVPPLAKPVYSPSEPVARVGGRGGALGVVLSVWEGPCAGACHCCAWHYIALIFFICLYNDFPFLVSVWGALLVSWLLTGRWRCWSCGWLGLWDGTLAGMCVVLETMWGVTFGASSPFGDPFAVWLWEHCFPLFSLCWAFWGLHTVEHPLASDACWPHHFWFCIVHVSTPISFYFSCLLILSLNIHLGLCPLYIAER